MRETQCRLRSGAQAIVGICLILIGRMAYATQQTLTTADTAIRIEAHDNYLTIALLRSTLSRWNWAAKNTPVLGLLSTVKRAGRNIPIYWRLRGAQTTTANPQRLTLTFISADPKMELRSIWTAASGPGPIEHQITIRNLSGSELILPLQTSLAMSVVAPPGHTLENWWVEKGAGWPTEVGTHHSQIEAGFSAALVSLPYSPDDPKQRDPIPWTAVQDTQGNQGWYAGIEFSGRTRIALTTAPGHPERLTTDLGLDPGEGGIPYSTRLAPGETFTAPAAFIGCYTGNVDDGANRLHRWVESHLRPPTHDPRYPLLVNNSWGSGMAVDERLARTMIDDAALLGLELYHIDAGWFHGVGDWYPDPQKFPHGLSAVADYAHSKGLKFGLWVGWTQGGNAPEAANTRKVLSVFNPGMKDWFTHDYPQNWKPQDFIGADLCLSDPQAQQWCLQTLRHIVRDNKLDLLEHDQRMIVEQCDRADHPHTAAPTDIAYRAANGYYHIYDTIRAENPYLLFEDCVNGGRTVDYGILRRVHYISITDSYTPLANRRAFYDASFALPPSMCECYLENDPVKSLAEFRALLRSGMMGWCTIMIDMSKWSTEQRADAARQFTLYKTLLRPLIAAGNLYHASERPDGVHWDGIQYADVGRKRAVLFAFRGATPQETHTFPVRGLDPDTNYRVDYTDRSSLSITRRGADLMRLGLTVHLNAPQTSEIVVLTRSEERTLHRHGQTITAPHFRPGRSQNRAAKEARIVSRRHSMIDKGSPMEILGFARLSLRQKRSSLLSQIQESRLKNSKGATAYRRRWSRSEWRGSVPRSRG